MALPQDRDRAGVELDVAVPSDAQTPSFVILEEAVRHNLRAMIAACGSRSRFMPHLKTHRAPWITELLVAEGVVACKVATPAEADLALSSGMETVLWAYPTVGEGNIGRFVASAREHPRARLVALVDSDAGVAAWLKALDHDPPANLTFRVDLDPGMGRTGASIGPAASDLARRLHRDASFDGWHVYDGHIKDAGRDARRRAVEVVAAKVEDLTGRLASDGIRADLVAGTSYTFDLWPPHAAAFVSSGSWTYSSNQHDRELTDLDWLPAGFVLATVVSTRNGTATLDAGSKAIAPDKPMAERFRWPGRILLMNEEHAVVESRTLSPGDKVLLLPQHACTSAYLYDEALVLTAGGTWERRPQLGSRR